jgi:hypothetical protein
MEWAAVVGIIVAYWVGYSMGHSSGVIAGLRQAAEIMGDSWRMQLTECEDPDCSEVALPGHRLCALCEADNV